jgi:16S rRNA C967 or C1407 C5-methylase (RsmB/RsmF family)
MAEEKSKAPKYLSGKKVRARTESGEFIADDPTTEKNEAWVSFSANDINKRRLKELNASMKRMNLKPIGRPLQELLAENLDDA